MYVTLPVFYQLLLQFIVVREDTLYHSSPFKMCWVFSCSQKYGLSCRMVPVQSRRMCILLLCRCSVCVRKVWFMVFFQVISLLLFYLVVLSIIENGVLKSLIIVELIVLIWWVHVLYRLRLCYLLCMCL